MALFPHGVVEMLSYSFMQKAFLAVGFMAVIAPLLGVFLVIRRQSLLADTLSHVSLAGVALGFFVGKNPTVMTLIVVLVAAIILEYLRIVYHTYTEIGTAILMSGGLAVAMILMSLNSGSETTSIQQYLFGSIVAISWGQVKVLGVLFIIIILAFLLFKRPMYVLTFDESTAAVDGLPVHWMSLGFNAITGVAIALMIPIAGALLVSAIMVLPAAIGMRLGKSFNTVIFSGIIVGLVGMLSGLASSYELDTPPGAMITVIFIGIFLVINGIQWLIKRLKRDQVPKNESL